MGGELSLAEYFRWLTEGVEAKTYPVGEPVEPVNIKKQACMI
jgi:hypothetical protein